MAPSVVCHELPTDSQHQIGVITLQAEKALNALNDSMTAQLYQQLRAWQQDHRVVCIVLTGQGDKAFCAGGDVRALRQAVLAGDQAAPLRFFTKEYRLDYLIHTYPKPLIAWGHGIVMGGGLGLLAGAAFRVVTEQSVLAMPEITIGLYPDVGGSWLLARMPANIGLFLALTGCQLNAADALYLGLANRLMAHTARADVITALQAAAWPGNNPYQTVHDVLKPFTLSHKHVPPANIKTHWERIVALVDQPALPAIMAHLAALANTTDDVWLQQVGKTALAGSPLSACISYAQQRKMRQASLRQVFQSELVLSVNCTLRGDFTEGVRALLIDKDQQPRWQFATVEAVDENTLASFFQPPWGQAAHPLADL